MIFDIILLPKPYIIDERFVGLIIINKSILNVALCVGMLSGAILLGGYLHADEGNVRKVREPSKEHIYLSAKRLELAQGGDKLEDAKAIYRMAIHNGATGYELEEAYMGLARCEYRQSNYWAAFSAIENSFPKSFDNAAVELRIKMELDLAGRLARTGDREATGAPFKKDANGQMLPDRISGLEAAAEIYKAVTYNDPKGPYAPRGLLMSARCYKEIGRYLEAEIEYRHLVETFPNSKESQKAQAELVEVLAKKSESADKGLEGEVQDEVLSRMLQARTVAKDSPELKESVDRAKDAIAETQSKAMLEKADFYIQRGNKKSREAAKFVLEDIIKKYPQTEAAKSAVEKLEKIK